jgi:hypothetical protein
VTVAVIGGRFDGGDVAGADLRWGWVGERGSELAVYSNPAAGRELYRLGEGGYLSAEHTHEICPGCGGLTAAGPACLGCDTALV